MQAPTGKLSSSSISIKKMMAPKDLGDDGKPVDLTNMPTNRYDIDDFKMAWRRFAHMAKDRGEKTIYNALIKRDPIQKGNDVFLLQLDNQIQIDTMRIALSDLLGYVRAELKNYNVNVKMELATSQDNEVKFQTGKDRFAALARKNPNLHALKKTFNLDIEF